MIKFFIKIISFFLIFICFTGTLSSQKSETISILDRVTKEAVPFATVYNLNGKTGFYTSPNGEIKKSFLTDSIEISCVGYYPQKVTIRTSTSIILLEPCFYKIDEVVINPKKYKSSTLGYYKNKVNPSLSFAQNGGTEMAVMIKNDLKKEAVLKKIIVALSVTGASRFNLDFISVFRVNLYEINDQLLIGDIVNKCPLIFTSKDLMKKTELDVFNKNIVIPDKGVFVAIEWLGKIDNNTNELEKAYDPLEPFLSLTTKPKGTIVYIRNIYSKENWKLFTGYERLKAAGLDKNYIPRISLELAY
jgi:hypothetical protein